MKVLVITMWKCKKLDFEIEPWRSDFPEGCSTRLIFRFYPRASSCHSFNDELPKSWDEVYKVYYAWAIFEQNKCGEKIYSKKLFDSRCDECSILDQIAFVCDKLAHEIYKEKVNGETWNYLNETFNPFGMGIFWEIKDCSSTYEFRMWDWFGVGYRFYIDKQRVGEFGRFLSDCCEYMLEHGEPI